MKTHNNIQETSENRDLLEINELISQTGLIYRKYFGEKILGQDNISQDTIAIYLGELISIFSQYKPNIKLGEELIFMWEDGLVIVKNSLINRKLKQSVSRCEIMIFELNKKIEELGGVSKDLNYENFWLDLVKGTEFDYSKPFFDMKKFDKFPKLYDELSWFIGSYHELFTLHDEDEKYYRKDVNNESLGICRRRMHCIYGGINDFFDSETKDSDKLILDSLIESRNPKKRKIYIEFIGELAKKYFLRKFLENKVISQEYCDYFHNTKKGWDAVKEFYYAFKRYEKAKEIILYKNNLSSEVIKEIKQSIDKIMKYEPKKSYRLLRNLKRTVENIDSLLGNLNTDYFGIKVKGIDNLNIGIADNGEKVILGVGNL